MPPRPIVRDSAVGDSPWCIEGTRFSVMQIQQDWARSGEPALAGYRRLGLTDDELAAVLAFQFPSIGTRQIEPEIIGLAVQCECGIKRRTHVTPPTYETDACPCGRVWQVQVTLTPVVRPDTEPVSVEGRAS
jgi:hypothetical protein